MQKTDHVVTAYYDLEVCPISFDFVNFLALAELFRRRHGGAALHVVVVPGPRDGFRDDDLQLSQADKVWRLQNIVVPSCWLLPDTPLRLSLCRHRDEAREIEAAAAGPVFPEGYRVDAPTADFLWTGIAAAHARGEALPRFAATPQAVNYVGAWLKQECGDRRPISITLRESSHADVRNSNTGAWADFARELARDGYHPIVLRDTERALAPAPAALDGLTVAQAIPFNLDLRLALYELCHLNLMIPNGPGVLCWLSDKARYLMYRIVNQAWVNTNLTFISSMGIKPGGQIGGAGPFQRLVWEEDTPDILRRHFREMIELIDKSEDSSNPPPAVEASEDPLETAARLQITGRVEEAASIYQEIVRKQPDNADAWHMLAIIAHQAGRADVAEKMVLRAIALKDGQANYFVTAAHVMDSLGRTEEAVNGLRRAIALAPKDAGAHADLAAILHRAGDRENAEKAMMTALKLAPDTLEYYERAGKMLQDAGNAAEAASFFRRAIDLRDEAAARAREASRHMSEIPRVTLKS